MTSDEVLNEFEKAKHEKDAQMAAIESSKRMFADYLRESNIQLQIKQSENVKRKLPFKLRWRNFINKFKYIMN